jgi:hypothetical protein
MGLERVCVCVCNSNPNNTIMISIIICKRAFRVVCAEAEEAGKNYISHFVQILLLFMTRGEFGEFVTELILIMMNCLELSWFVGRLKMI